MKTLRPLLSLVAALCITLPAVAQAATPFNGVPTQVRRGFYTETDMGAFFTFGGEGANPSNPQAYLSLGVGYDLYAVNNHLFSLGLGFSMGTSAGSCFGTYDETKPLAPCRGSTLDPTTNQPVVLSDNWTATTVEGSLLYGYQLVPRLMLTFRGLGGVAFVQPQAFDSTENPIPLVGAGTGLEYATQFDHFSLGLDIAGKFLLGPNTPGLAIAPRVKYTF